MTDYAADAASGVAGTTLTVRTGTASADTVPAGAYVVWRNTGAGTHVVTLTTNNTYEDLAIADRTISIAAGAFKGGRINSAYGDANGRVQVGIDGATPSEVTYMIIGGI